MTRYQRIARIEQNSDLELWEVADYLNGEIGDYYIMWSYSPGEYYLVKEDDEGNVFVGGDIVEEEGDVLGSTDEVGNYLDDEDYYVVEFPQGNRKLAWIEE